ncbi:MAG: DUF1080 domain-containing protein [Kiritimatiellae bacterium]|nr:DUF1080 domain-containing protein [Kiritimatiellia bacterium]
MKHVMMATAGAVLLTTTLITQAADNQICPVMEKEGWQCLFDGKTLEGWTVKSGFATYKVEDGAIVGTTAEGSGNTFLTSNRTFKDFEIIFDVKLDNNELNSGIQTRSKLKGDKYGGRVYGPQCEIMLSPGHSGFIYAEATGKGWASEGPKKKGGSRHEFVKNGEWNSYRIIEKGPHIQTWINGNKVEDFMYPKDLHEMNPEGFFGLQVHGIKKGSGPWSARWKNIYIKEIK